MAGKPCDRCGACNKDVNAYDDFEEQEPAMCAEVHVAFGLVSWLCFNCRREYHRFSKSHPLNRIYGEASLSFSFWESRVGPNTPSNSINEGLELWRNVENIEMMINEAANKWLISDLDNVRTR